MYSMSMVAVAGRVADMPSRLAEFLTVEIRVIHSFAELTIVVADLTSGVAMRWARWAQSSGPLSAGTPSSRQQFLK